MKIIEFDMFANTMNVISVSLRMMAEHLFLLLSKLLRISDFCPLSWNRLAFVDTMCTVWPSAKGL